MILGKRTFHGEKPAVETMHPTHATQEGALRDAIAAAGGIDASNLEVVSTDHGIYLKGTLLSREEMEKCLLLAQQTGQPVINELTVLSRP